MGSTSSIANTSEFGHFTKAEDVAEQFFKELCRKVRHYYRFNIYTSITHSKKLILFYFIGGNIGFGVGDRQSLGDKWCQSCHLLSQRQERHGCHRHDKKKRTPQCGYYYHVAGLGFFQVYLCFRCRLQINQQAIKSSGQQCRYHGLSQDIH